MNSMRRTRDVIIPNALSGTHVLAREEHIRCINADMAEHPHPRVRQLLQQAKQGINLPTPINLEEMERLLDGYDVEKRIICYLVLSMGSELVSMGYWHV